MLAQRYLIFESAVRSQEKSDIFCDNVEATAFLFAIVCALAALRQRGRDSGVAENALHITYSLQTVNSLRGRCVPMVF